MRRENHVTAFYIEVLLLTVGLIGIVLVLGAIILCNTEKRTGLSN